MHKIVMDSRRKLGIPKFERECRLCRMGRIKKAYKVPGTPEHGDYHLLQIRLLEIVKAKKSDHE